MAISHWPSFRHIWSSLAYASATITSFATLVWWIPYASVHSSDLEKEFLSCMLCLIICLGVVSVILATVLEILDHPTQKKPVEKRWSTYKIRAIPHLRLGLEIFITLLAMSLALEVITNLAIAPGNSRILAEYANKSLQVVAAVFFGVQVLRAAASV